MGSGIAEVAARAGFATVVREINEDVLAHGRARLERSLGTAVQRGKLAEAERDQALRALSFTTELEALRECDIVVEAATEKLAVKKELFAQLDQACQPGTI